jgi:glycosyltransferase involved in cell wall biosynthesis
MDGTGSENLMNPLFSVITVCLNAGLKLRATVESILNQTWGNLEVVVKDGGSKDDSLSLLPQDSRVCVVVSPDRGIYDAMNQALSIARGTYVLFLNAGDVFAANDVLSQVAICVKQSNHPSLVYTDYTMARNATQHYGQPPHLSGFMLFRNTLCHQTCYFHRSCYDRQGRFDVTLRIYGDYEFLLRVWRRETLVSVHLPIVGVVYEGGGISARPENALLGQSEVRKARQRHFSPAHRVWFQVQWTCTLPRVRNWVVSPDRDWIIQRTYIWFRNMLYRLQRAVTGG